MNRQTLAALLVIIAATLGIGSYLIIADKNTNESEVHGSVTPPDNGTNAPAWVDTGQQAEPDYSSATTEAHNATPVPENPVTEAPNEPVEDKIVTFSFVESLADFLLHRFHPQDTNGRPATMASARNINMYYGRELDGFAVQGQDVISARQTVLDHAFNPTMLQALYKLYSPIFLDHLVDTALLDEREYTEGETKVIRTLTQAEVIAMLRLNSLRMQQTAAVFKTVTAQPNIMDDAAKYIRAAKAVERANAQLQNAMSDGKNTAEAGAALKRAIMQREETKASIIRALKKACPNCQDNDLFYLAQWCHRRTASGHGKAMEAIAEAATILDDLATAFMTRADKLL